MSQREFDVKRSAHFHTLSLSTLDIFFQPSKPCQRGQPQSARETPPRFQPFSIHFCSDHGSVIAKGNGERLQKYLIDDFAKRAVIIPEEASALTEFEKIDIPFVKHKKLVLPEGRTMFTQKDKIEINHGGISLEEIVVPFITVIK